MKRVAVWVGLMACVFGAEPRDSATTGAMRVHVLRLRPGQDLLRSLAAFAEEKQIRAGVVLTTVGSLNETRLRLANRQELTVRKGKAEIVSLVGTIDARSAHLHLSVSDGRGRTFGGHLVEGCPVCTTAEIVIGEMPELRFSREKDVGGSGYEELKVDVMERPRR